MSPKQPQEILDRMAVFYLMLDGSYMWPNSKEGDLLKMVHKWLTSAPDVPDGEIENTLTTFMHKACDYEAGLKVDLDKAFDEARAALTDYIKKKSKHDPPR